jgi:hypothetical protein
VHLERYLWGGALWRSLSPHGALIRRIAGRLTGADGPLPRRRVRRADVPALRRAAALLMGFPNTASVVAAVARQQGQIVEPGLVGAPGGMLPDGRVTQAQRAVGNDAGFVPEDGFHDQATVADCGLVATLRLPLLSRMTMAVCGVLQMAL